VIERATYTKETDLCSDFSAWAAKEGWVSYPETHGWDILLVGSAGYQIGVQAKLHFNATLLRQSLPALNSEEHPGPDFRAVVLPKYSNDIHDVCRAIGIDCFFPNTWGERAFRPKIVTEIMHDWCPVERLKLPAYVPDCAAGASSPVTLTDWKIRALRVCAHIETRGHITPKEIRSYGVDSRRFTASAWGWLKPHPTIRGAYVLGNVRFPAQHPKVYEQIKCEMLAVQP
jgi:hypothetical protein